MSFGDVTFNDPFGFGTTTNGEQSTYLLPTDIYEANQVAATVPADSGRPWWETMAMYGITRAIDNQFGTPQIGNSNPGSFAGQNGRTYESTPTPMQPRTGVFAQADAQTGGGLGLLVLIGAAVMVFSEVA